MNPKDEEIILTPVRTRGALQLRSPAPPASQVSTRGKVRTRGTKPSLAPEQTRATTLIALVQQLRERVEDLPLTVLIHGWGSLSAEEFYKQLTTLLRRDDALWLIPADQHEASTTPPETEDAVILDLRRDAGQRTYRNLIGDLVFFPASAETEGTLVSEWQRRANAIVANGREAHCDAVLRAGSGASLMTYRWEGQDDLTEYVLL